LKHKLGYINSELKNIRKPLDALSVASIFHYNKSTPKELKKNLND